MNKNWCNTVLVAYSALPKIARELDFGVETRVNSTFQSKHLKNGVTTEQLIGEIIALNEEKRKIVNLRYIVSTAIGKLNDAERQILILRLCRKQTFKQIFENTQVPMRTLFRRFDAAEKKFRTVLTEMGYGEEWLKNEYGGDKYIAAVHQRIVDEKYFVAKSAK